MLDSHDARGLIQMEITTLVGQVQIKSLSLSYPILPLSESSNERQLKNETFICLLEDISVDTVSFTDRDGLCCCEIDVSLNKLLIGWDRNVSCRVVLCGIVSYRINPMLESISCYCKSINDRVRHRLAREGLM